MLKVAIYFIALVVSYFVGPGEIFCLDRVSVMVIRFVLANDGLGCFLSTLSLTEASMYATSY